MNVEVWAQVTGFPAYHVSTWGRVKSSHGAGRFLKPMMTGVKGNQYETLLLCCQGKTRTVKVHVLVLEAFVGPRPTGCVGCHKDDVRRNNRLDNLYWGTQKTNAQDRVRNGHHFGQLLSVDQVREIRRRRKAGERGVDLAAEFGVSQQIVWNVYSGRTGSHVED